MAEQTGKPSDDATKQGQGGLAHRPDGSDDSASFGAQIADEGTIPDADPNDVVNEPAQP